MYTINMEQCDQIVGVYQEQAEECVRAVNVLCSETERLARKTCFEPLVDFGNRLYDFYQGEMKQHLMTQFRSWYNGDHSFHALMRSINAGDAAYQNARSRMDQMESALENLFRTSGGNISVPTYEPKISDKEFDEYQDALQRCGDTIAEALSSATSRMDSLRYSNDVAALTYGIIKTTGISLQEAFEKLAKQIDIGNRYVHGGTTRTTGAADVAARTTRTADVRINWNVDDLI